MGAVLRRYRSLEVSPDTHRRWAYATVAFFVVIIAFGAAVRLTGSGLGCPDWPRCHGSFVPELDMHKWIEYGNRLVSGLAIVPVLGTLISARRRVPHERGLERLSWLLLAGLLVQGALGAITVKLHLRWGTVMAHFLLALALLTIAVIIAWRARASGRPPGGNDLRTVVLSRTLAAYGGLVIVVGTFATAAGPHAGGAGTGDIVQRLDFMGPETLRRLILAHGHLATVLGLCTVALFFFARRRGARPGLVRALAVAAVLMAVQGVVGLVQYHSGLPSELVWFHASAAAGLWATFVVVALEAGRPVRPDGGESGDGDQTNRTPSSATSSSRSSPSPVASTR
jgi:heme a synthase